MMRERLVGVIHLGPLPGSPRYAGDLGALVDRAAREARILAGAGFDAVVVENFGDTPFVPRDVHPVTIAAMTRCALAVADAAPSLALGINVLRNDARAALAIAAATAATMVRVNVHSGAMLTDQGLIEGRAHETLRERRALGLEHVRLLCDVAVKHAAPLAPRPLAEEVAELCERAGAEAILVTGHGTGAEPNHGELAEVLAASRAPVLIASGSTPANVAALLAVEADGRRPHGVIVGSTLRDDGRAGAPLDPARAERFASAFRAATT
jgi:uncharacterized protein